MQTFWDAQAIGPQCAWKSVQETGPQLKSLEGRGKLHNETQRRHPHPRTKRHEMAIP